jgi:hypothetical protein
MDDVVEKALKQFKASQDAWAEIHQEAEDDIRFARLGEQWPEDIKNARELEGKPTLVINRLPSFIRNVVNDARMSSPSIKVFPVDDYSDPKTAEVINGIIRNIEANSNSEAAYDKALEDAVTCSIGFFRIDIDYAYEDSFDLDCTINRIFNPLSVYPDANTTAVDGADWEYCFVIEVMTHDEFKRTYPDAEPLDFHESDNVNGWVTEDEVTVAEYWLREEVETEFLLMATGETICTETYEEDPIWQTIPIANRRKGKKHTVKQRIINAQEVLEEKDFPSRYIPIIPCYGDEVVVGGDRKFLSLVRQAKDAQKNYNYWRSSATGKVALATKAPWIGEEGAFDKDPNWDTANTVDHPYLQYKKNSPMPQQIPNSMADAGSIQEALSASDDLKDIMGIQNASLGIASNETSGKAIIARQKEGDINTFHYIDNLKRSIKYAGKILLDIIPKIYDRPRVLRIIGYDGEPDTVRVNEEYGEGEHKKIIDITKGKYDLVVKTGANQNTQRQEAAEQMMTMLKSFPDAAPYVGDLLAKSLDWVHADEIAKRMKMLLPPEVRAMDEMEDIPPEIQPVLSQMQNQLQQYDQLIQQGQAVLMEKDKEIEQLQMQSQSKSQELQLKEMDSQRDFQAKMAKIEADKEMTAYKESQENKRMLLDEMANYLRDYVDNTRSQQNEMVSNLSGEMAAKVEQLGGIVEQLVQNTRSKEISIQAPSGGTYQGIVEDGEVTIIAPSGAEYTGEIH